MTPPFFRSKVRYVWCGMKPFIRETKLMVLPIEAPTKEIAEWVRSKKRDETIKEKFISKFFSFIHPEIEMSELQITQAHNQETGSPPMLPIYEKPVMLPYKEPKYKRKTEHVCNHIEMDCTNPLCRKMQYWNQKDHRCQYCLGYQIHINNNLQGKTIADRMGEELTSTHYYELEMHDCGVEFREGEKLDIDEVKESEPEEFHAHCQTIKRYGLGVDNTKGRKIWDARTVAEKLKFKKSLLNVWSQDKEINECWISTPADFKYEFEDKVELADATITKCRPGCNQKHYHSHQLYKVFMLHPASNKVPNILGTPSGYRYKNIFSWNQYNKARKNVEKKQIKLKTLATPDELKWVRIYCNKFGFKIPDDDFGKLDTWNAKQFTWEANLKCNPKGDPKRGFKKHIEKFLKDTPKQLDAHIKKYNEVTKN